MTTYNVSATLVTGAGVALPGRDVTATLVDANLNEVDGFVTAVPSIIINRVEGRTDSAGTCTLALVANADITPANTYYAVRADGQESPWLIAATASDDVQALLVDDPSPLAPGLLSAHLTDTTAAHAASAISFSPTGTVAATDVQAAIAEVASEKALLAHASQHAGAGSDPITSLGAVSFGGGISLTGTSSVADRKITMQSTTAIYMPDQAAFPGVIYVGSAGGGSLAAGAQINTAVGTDSMTSMTSGSANVAVGASSLRSNTTGYSNIAMGWASLYEVTTGINNVGLGYATGRGITTGSGNTVIGAGITGLAAGAASLTLVGYTAGVNNTGTALTAVGYTAATGNTGTSVTAIGYNAGASNTHNDVILLGRDCIADGTNQFVVGSAGYLMGRWVPGHDPNSFLYWGGSDTLDVYLGGSAKFSFSTTGVGFNGTAASAKPTITGSRGGNAALADLLTKLAAMGLLTDSTS